MMWWLGRRWQQFAVGRWYTLVYNREFGWHWIPYEQWVAMAGA